MPLLEDDYAQPSRLANRRRTASRFRDRGVSFRRADQHKNHLRLRLCRTGWHGHWTTPRVWSSSVKGEGVLTAPSILPGLTANMSQACRGEVSAHRVRGGATHGAAESAVGRGNTAQTPEL